MFRGPYFEMVAENLRRLAAESGLVIRSPGVLANTHLALQAAEFARDAGCLEPFHNRLFAAYLQEGQNIVERGKEPRVLRLLSTYQPARNVVLVGPPDNKQSPPLSSSAPTPNPIVAGQSPTENSAPSANGTIH